MSEGGRHNRPGTSPSGQTPQATPKGKSALRSLRPGELGAARMNPIHEERSSAAEQIQRSLKAWRAASGKAGPASIPKGSGAPLSADVRARMEPKLGASLGNVRVHTSGESAQASQDLGARAFTVGEDVHFGAGEFAPGSKEGDQLLAHELTHVVQGQKAGVQRKAEHDDAGGDEKSEKGGAEVSDPSEPAEKEADATAEKVGADLHGGGEKKKGEGKKKDGEGAEKGAAGEEHDGEKKAEAGKEKGGAEKADHDDGGATQKERAPPVAAKLISAAPSSTTMRIMRAVKGPDRDKLLGKAKGQLDDAFTIEEFAAKMKVSVGDATECINHWVSTQCVCYRVPFDDKRYTFKKPETLPTLPDKTIANEQGIEVWHNYGNQNAGAGTPVEHAPIHFHVKFQNQEYQLFPSGQPIQNEAKPVPRKLKQFFDERRSNFQNIADRIGRWYEKVGSKK